MNRTDRIRARQIKDASLQSRYTGLVSLHASALMARDSMAENALRQQLHDCIDEILDGSAELVNLMCHTDEQE